MSNILGVETVVNCGKTNTWQMPHHSITFHVNVFLTTPKEEYLEDKKNKTSKTSLLVDVYIYLKLFFKVRTYSITTVCS